MLRKQLRPAIAMTLVLCIITGLDLSRRGDGSGAATVPRAGERFAGHGERPSGWQCTDRPVVHAVPSTSTRVHRPRATGTMRTASGGTNKGPTDRKLADTLIAQAVDSAVKNDGGVKGKHSVATW